MARHGARAPVKSAIPNQKLKSWPQEKLAKLTKIGFNQAFLQGVTARMNYPKFLNKITINEIKLNARYIQRTIKTAYTYVDGVLNNFRNFHLLSMKKNYSWPYYLKKGSIERNCWKKKLWKRVTKF